MRLEPDHQAEAKRIAAEITAIVKSGMVLPGSVSERRMRCGRQGCRCHADPPVLHGPYWAWTRKVKAKTVARWLSDEQLADYQPYFDNAKRLRALTSELEALSLAAVEADPRWDRQGRRPRTIKTADEGR
jgi:hypothetical protein